jgi:tetratricopeptide (TPR) repeat protein
MPKPSPKAQRSLLRWAAGVTLVVTILFGAGNAVMFLHTQVQLIRAQWLCERALSNRDWPGLELAAQRLLDLNASNGDAWLYLAQAFEERDNPLRAAAALSKVPPSHPQVADALRRQVDLDLGSANRPLEAEVALERLLELEPKNPEVHQQLIGFYARTFQQTRLCQQIRDSIASGHEPVEAYLYLAAADGWLVWESLPIYERWIQGHPNCPIFATAHALCLAHQHPIVARSSREIRTTLNRFADNLEVLAYHIEQSMTDGDVARVSELLDQAPLLSRKDHRFWRYAGWLHHQRGQPEEAESMYHQSLEIHPLSWKTRRCLAELLTDQGRHDEIPQVQPLADQGKNLEQEISRQRELNPPPILLIEQIAAYAAACHDSLVIAGIARHLPKITPRISGTSQTEQ